MSTDAGRRRAQPAASATLTLLVSALLVVVGTRAAIDRVPPEGLTISVLLSGSDPYAQMPLFAAVMTALGRSLLLAAAALLIAIPVGVGTGILATEARYRWLRGALWMVGTAGVAMPTFFWAILLQLAVIVIYTSTGTRVAPTAGVGLDEHVLLPALALAARPAAYLFRTTATAVGEVRQQDFVRSAIAKGLSRRWIVTRHIAPNVAPTVTASVLLAARMALSSLLIVEYVFSWPGAGLGFVAAVARRDLVFAASIGLGFVMVFSLLGRLSRWASAGLARRRFSE